MSDHIGDANKMICPHCGLPYLRQEDRFRHFGCGSSYSETMKPEWARSMTCLEIQNGQLQERIKRLEAIINRASVRFFADGADGLTAVEMLNILDESKEAKS